MKSGERGARSEEPRRLLFACAFVMLASTSAIASPFSFDDIQYWVGEGANRAALVVDWTDESTEPPALAWGYRWDGTARGKDMLMAVVAEDPRLFAKLNAPPATASIVYGLGYDANGDVEFGIDDDTTFDSHGFAVSEGPADGAAANCCGDYYAEGWFGGFWHYGVASTNPYDGGSWSDTFVGMENRMLADGAWDSWTFSPTFNFSSFAQNPVAAPPPIGDFNRDGHIDAADYGEWRGTFGSESELAADANANTLVDAADYVLWRQYAMEANEFASGAHTVPEAAGISLVGVVFTWVVLTFQGNRLTRRRGGRRANKRPLQKLSACSAPLRETILRLVSR